MNRAALLPALLLTTPLLMAGCLECRPVFEVRSCMEGMDHCEPPAEAVRPWSARHAAQWPDLEHLMSTMHAGLHEHIRIDSETEAEFWAYWGFPSDEHQRDLYVMRDSILFHIRVPSCD